MRSRPNAFWLSGAIVCVLLARPAAGQTALTGRQIMERSQKAYNALKSYQGVTRVSVQSNMNGMGGHYNTSANIQFLRPGRIRMTGTLMTSGKFAMVSDGRNAWMSWPANGGKWEKQQNDEMAIAGLTGISMSAATTIPSALLQLHWGNPFALAAQANGKVGAEMINGRRTYRVKAASPIGDETFWIDQKTFLFVKIMQHRDLSKMHMPAQGGRAMQGGMNSVQTFSNVKINAPIPPGVFARPAGASP